MAYKQKKPIIVSEGGTGNTTLTTHTVLLGNSTSPITQLTNGTTGQILTAVTGSDPAWSPPAASSISIAGDTGGPLTGNSFTFTGSTTGLTFAGAGSTETLSGTLVVANGGTGTNTLTSHGVLLGNTTSAVTATTAGTTGQVLTGVTGSAPVFASPAASSITVTGDTGGGLTGNSFTFTGGTTGLTFAGAGSTETLGGTLIVSNGGTGAATLTGVLIGNGTSAVTGNAITQHDVLVGGVSNAITSIAPSATSGIPLVSAGSAADPAFGTAVVAGGGTGAVSFTAHGVLLGEGTSAIGVTAAGTTGQVLTGVTGSDPVWASPSASSISITGDTGGALTGNSFTFAGGTTGLSFGGSGSTETLTFAGITANGGTVSLATDATTSTINVGTGAGVKTSTFGSTNSTSTTTIACGTGGASFGTSANAHTTTMGSTTSNSATTVQSGTGGLSVTSNNGLLTINSGTGSLGISTDATTNSLNLGTGAGQKTVTLGSTSLGSTFRIQSSGSSAIDTTNSVFGITSGTGTMFIATDATNQTVNFATGTGNKTLNLGSSFGTSSTNISSGSNNVGINAGLTIDTTGRNFNTTQPAFQVYQSTSPTNVTGDGTVYTFALNTVVLNQGSYFDTSTFTFTAPIKGFYQFNLAAILSNVLVGTTMQLLVHTNIQDYNGFYINPVSAAAAGALIGGNMAIAIPLLATNTVVFRVIVTGGTKTIGVTGGATFTYASGYLIC